MTIQNLPLSQLVPSPANVRKTDTKAGLDELVASIEANGILQNLIVRKVDGGRFEVIAGERRRKAAAIICKEQKRRADDYPVPCDVLDADAPATEISLAENQVREAMHPADQFEAFQKLADEGQGDETIAARFGVSTHVVRQRLKLAKVSPKIVAAFRKGELSLECVMAFAVTDDHKAQDKVWKEWRQFPGYEREPGNIRAMLTEAHIDADNRLAKFVTVKAYEEAGGPVVRDLFSDDHHGWLTDAGLLMRLVAEKLEKAAESVRGEGWKWVVADPAFGWEQERNYRQLDKRGGDYSAKARATSGAVVTIAHDGKLEVKRGLLNAEDQRAIRKAEAAKADRKTAKADAVESGLSAALVENLTAHRTAALAAKMVGNPKVALVAVVHALALDALFEGATGHSALRISGTVCYRARSAEGIEDGAAAKEQAEATSAAMKGMPKNPEKLWDWLTGQDQKTLLAILAACAAATIDTIEKHGDAECEAAGLLAAALKIDMADYWQPTAAGYFSRVSKEQTLAAIGDACGAGATSGFAGLKKTVLAEAAERKLKGLRWLPAMLRAA